MNINSPYDEN